MIQVKFRVKKIQINLTEWQAENEGDLNNQILYKPYILPFEIAYHKSWIMRLECGACHEIINVDKSAQHSEKTLDCLFEPYYSKETLQSIASLFKNMKVFSNFEEPNKLFLTHQSYHDKNAATLFIPKIRLHHNICPNCNTSILYWIKDEHPRMPSREYHNGGLGYLRVYEIIGVEVENNLYFIDVLG